MSGEVVVNGIFSDALWALGVVGLLLAIAAGVMLVASPATALRLGERLNREFSIAWLQRALDEPRQTEPFIYRHHRAFGFALVLATLYFFWTFSTAYRVDTLAAMYAGVLPAAVLDILALVVTTVLVIGNALGFALGVTMLIRPSAIKRAEALANRWVDTDRAAAVLDRRVDRPEGLAHRYPRRIGVVILLASAYIVVIAWVALK